MWEREVKKGDLDNLRGARELLKFLWKSDNAPIYIMDNHLAAAWCWMQECNAEEKYNFMHIDQHSDLGVRGIANNIAFLKSNSQISLDDYCKITYSNCVGINKSFQCDNYITACRFLFPNWFNTNLFYYTEPYVKGSTVGSGYENFTPQRMKTVYLLQDITLFVGEQEFSSTQLFIDENMKEKKWIVNLDLDFFWDRNENRLFDDQFINDLGIVIANAMKNIQVLTIALSPLWCGGWRNALECSKLFLSSSMLQKSCKDYFEENKLFK
jgi:hypothetical protein